MRFYKVSNNIVAPYTTRYFRSKTDAKKYGVKLVRQFVDYERKYVSNFSLNNVMYDAHVDIEQCVVAKADKQLIIDILNTKPVDMEINVQFKWTPQDRWVATS
jgi:hypothetical protein